MAGIFLGEHRLPIPLGPDGVMDLRPQPDLVLARVRALLPQVRAVALDAHDHRLPEAVVGDLHSAANALQDALGRLP